MRAIRLEKGLIQHLLFFISLWRTNMKQLKSTYQLCLPSTCANAIYLCPQRIIVTLSVEKGDNKMGDVRLQRERKHNNPMSTKKRHLS